MSLSFFHLNSYHFLGLAIACLFYLVKNPPNFFFLSLGISFLINFLFFEKSSPNLTYSLLINGLCLLLLTSSEKNNQPLTFFHSLIFICVISIGQLWGIFAPILALILSFLFKTSTQKTLYLSFISLLTYMIYQVYDNLHPEPIFTTILISLLTFFISLKVLNLFLGNSKKTIRLIAYVLLTLSLIYFYKESRSIHQYTFTTMGTEMTIRAHGKNKPTFLKTNTKIHEKLAQINQSLSSYKETSELNFINANASKKIIQCSAIFWDNLLAAKQAFFISDGLFDITISPLLELWGLKNFDKQKLPSDDEIRFLLQKIGFDKIIMNEKEKTIFFKNKFIKLDFGGLTKGYAIDEVIKILQRNGFQNILVNLGGNIRVTGKSQKIGIQNPQNQEIITHFSLHNQAISTSGNYQRYITINGKRYSHIINPITGKPAENISSVSITTSTALWADILSTILFLYPNNDTKRAKFLNQTQVSEAFFIGKNPQYKTYRWKRDVK